jgi:hypothetical protein
MSHGYLKCHCEHCDNPIEYPVESAGETVRCPHCQLPTPLSVPGGETEPEEGVVVGGRMGKFVVGGLAVLLITALGVAGTVLYVNRLKGQKRGAGGKPAAVPADGAGAVMAVPAGDWQKVKPVVGKFQGGYTAAQVKEGRYVLGGMCTECHKIYDPITFPPREWDNIARNMRGKAKLRAYEFDDMQVFVKSLR